MNYLAHAYLSFRRPDILTGNLISDFVKGKKMFDYPEGIQQGIRLHRAIDAFTDTHAATAEAKEIFRPHYRLYSGAFVDVMYDHFLANDSKEFSEEGGLMAFSREVYASLDGYVPLFPPGFATVFPYMKQYNWLYGYREREGIMHSFQGLVRRSAYLTESSTAFSLFEEHYTVLQQCYDNFFPSVKAFVLDTLAKSDA
jgi:acyl carrier protein phosphodiesterase